jgi:hypothetical protein
MGSVLTKVFCNSFPFARSEDVYVHIYIYDIYDSIVSQYIIFYHAISLLDIDYIILYMLLGYGPITNYGS